jgi:hypothetical protein
MFFWHVPAPNEALLISGSKRRKEATQFRIVTGHGSFVMPVKQKARILSLALQDAEIVEDCITQQGIRLNVRAVAARLRTPPATSSISLPRTRRRSPARLASPRQSLIRKPLSGNWKQPR